MIKLLNKIPENHHDLRAFGTKDYHDLNTCFRVVTNDGLFLRSRILVTGNHVSLVLSLHSRERSTAFTKHNWRQLCWVSVVNRVSTLQQRTTGQAGSLLGWVHDIRFHLTSVQHEMRDGQENNHQIHSDICCEWLSERWLWPTCSLKVLPLLEICAMKAIQKSGKGYGKQVENHSSKY